MAWNTPGNDNNPGDGTGGNRNPSKGGERRNPWPPRRDSGGGLGDLVDRLRGMFDGGSGSPWRWVLVVLGLWLLFNCFVLVAEQERGVVLRFGKFARVMQPGPALKFPWPIESVTKVNATQISSFSVSVPILTSDENIVTVEINVQYKISDARLSLFGTRDAVEVLKQATLSSVREQVGRSNLDTVLGSRDVLADAAEQRLQRSLDAYRTGLIVTELNLPNARPPEEVKPAFDDVNSAQQDKDRLISEALAYAAKIVPEARGEAARTRTVAEGYKTSKIARATGDATRFSLLVQQYRNAPEVTRKRLWLETVQSVLGDNRKIIGGDSRQLLYLPMESRQRRAGDASAVPSPEMIAPLVTTTPDTTDVVREPRSKGRDGDER